MLSDKLVYSLHRISGLVGGLFILIITLTGSILVIDKQVDALVNPLAQPIEAVGSRLSYDQLLATLHRQYPSAMVRNVELPETNTQPVRVDLRIDRERKRAALNPYTGAVISVQNFDEAFVREVRDLHEELLLGPVGGYLMGLVGLCLLASVLTGLWYYRRSLRTVFSVGVRWNKSRRLVYADLHKWLGVVACLFMFMMGATGVFFHWEKIERSFGEGERRDRSKAAAQQNATFPIDAAIATAKKAIPSFEPQVMQLPAPGDSALVLRGNFPNSIRLFGKYNVSATINAYTGQLVSSFDARDAGLEYKAEHILEELHFGKYGGWVSQIIYILLALATAIVTFTGLVLWWLKRE